MCATCSRELACKTVVHTLWNTTCDKIVTEMCLPKLGYIVCKVIGEVYKVSVVRDKWDLFVCEKINAS